VGNLSSPGRTLSSVTPALFDDASSLPDWTGWVSVAQNGVQILALVVGAAFAYWKFFRGRTFHRRLEPTVNGERVAADSVEAIRARVTLKNTGASNVPLHRKALRVFAVGPDGWGTTKTPEWERLATVPVFEEHEWVESEEVISDEVLIPVRPAELVPWAYRVVFVVDDDLRFRRTGPRRKKSGGWSWRHGHRWVSEAIVLREVDTPRDGSQGTLEKELK
jgi:hypothetical protein